jgi:hypothetical protein
MNISISKMNSHRTDHHSIIRTAVEATSSGTAAGMLALPQHLHKVAILVHLHLEASAILLEHKHDADFHIYFKGENSFHPLKKTSQPAIQAAWSSLVYLQLARDWCIYGV